MKVLRYDTPGFNWIQVRSEIVVKLENLNYGARVSISRDGKVVAMSEECFNYRAGRAHVGEYDGWDWSHKGSSIVGQSAGEIFGIPLSSSEYGARIAIGEQLNSEVVQFQARWSASI